MPKQALYKNYDIENQFHIGLNALDIDLSFSEIERETLEYTLRIPKTNISSRSKQDFSKLLIGVILGGDRNGNNRKGSNSGISLGQQRSSGGGGRQGPRGGGGRQGGSGKPPQENGQKMTSKTYWIHTSDKKQYKDNKNVKN